MPHEPKKPTQAAMRAAEKLCPHDAFPAVKKAWMESASRIIDAEIAPLILALKELSGHGYSAADMARFRGLAEEALKSLQ